MSSKLALAEARKLEEINDRCRTFLQVLQNEEWPYYDRTALRNIEFVSASPGRVEYKFTVGEHQCNSMGNLHGGCAATILDDLTSATTLTLPTDEGIISVSRSLGCTYLKALPVGEQCTVVGELTRGGQQLLHMKGEIRGSDGKPAVVCSHDKVRLNPPRL